MIEKNLKDKSLKKLWGTNSFAEFYRNTGFWVSAEAMYRMSEYFRIMAERTKQMEQPQ